MAFLHFLEGIRNPVLDFLFSLITLCGEETVFMAIGMMVFWCIDKYRGYYLLCVGFVGTVINQFLKMVCRVPRPWIKDPSFTIVESAREAASGYSFPSGHTQTAVGLFGGIARATSRKWLRVSMIVLALLVALSRMYLGVHTPADVLTSLVIATVLLFGLYPLFERARTSPRVMAVMLFSFIGIMIAYLFFIMCYPFPAEVYAEEAIHNLESARKNGFTLLGCALGLPLIWAIDLKWTHFETRASLPIQILKIVGGVLLVIAVKELLRAPLETILGGHLAARSARYFLMVVVGGGVWPMSFRYLSKIGSKNK